MSRTIPSPLQIIRQELPKFLREDHAQDFVDTASLVVPTTPEDVGLGMLFGPFSKPIRAGGLAIAGMGYSPEAEGAFVGSGARIGQKLLNRAKELWSTNKPNKDVWSETGWFKGPDGMWRREIPDNDMEFRLDFDNIAKSPRGLREQRDMPLGGLLRHSRLTDAYPSLMGKYRADIIRYPDWLPDSSTGGSQKPPYAGNRFIKGTPGNIEIRAKTLPDALDTMVHELQHAIQSYEGMALGGDPSQFRPAGPLREALARARLDPDGFDRTLNTFDFDIERMLAKAVEDPYEAYRRLAGEAEARAVEKRRMYSPEQRMQVFPLEDYDVPLNELIFR